jgi:type II secretory pathway pseudopilin PulG
MRRARDDEGFALVTSIIILTVMIGLGMGLLFLTDSQQKASAREQASESAFNVAEAALNAQIGQLSHLWPASEFPSSCTASSSTESNGCPGVKDLEVGYPKGASPRCPAGTPRDAWGSALTNEWTTYVRDDGALGSPATQLFNSKTEQTEAPTYDANKDLKLFVRSVGVVQCRVVVVVALASGQLVTVPFPISSIAANWFETSNSGNKVVVNTQGDASGQAGSVSMRCSGFTGTETEIEEKCKIWDKLHGQVNPDTTHVAGDPSVTLSASQLEGIKAEAKINKTYFAAGTCPGSLAELRGKPTYVEGPCELSYTVGTGNSEKEPGFLVLINGTFKLNGNAEFFGTVYAANAQSSSGAVVDVHGDANVTGSIVVDGNGGISFGSSHENFTYNPAAAKELTSFVGASATRNSFRVLPVSQ